MKNQFEKIEDYLAPADVHEAQQEKESGVLTFIVALLLLAAEVMLVRSVLLDQLSPALGLLLHVVILAVLAGYAFMSVRRGEGRLAFLLLMSVAVLGPFGAGGAILSIIIYRWCARRPQAFRKWFETLFLDFAENESQRIYDEIRSGRDESAYTYNVIPFLDILTFGDDLQKQRALAKINLNFQPSFAPVLKKALNDSSNSVRVQAATAIAKIESQFQDRAMQLSALKEKYGGDPLIIWALAELYDDYSYTGLLGAEREKVNRHKAFEHYEEYLRLKPDDLRAYARIGRLFIRNEEYEKARDWLRQCIERGDTSPTVSDWYSEALFGCRQYDDLRHYQANLPHSGIDPEMRSSFTEALTLWAGDKHGE